MDPLAISYELAQPDDDTPFTAACLERAALEVAKDCSRFGIPPVVLAYVSGDNHEAPGIARHDRSANGDKWGKTDPGRLFDDRAFEARVRHHMRGLVMDKKKEIELGLRRAADDLQGKLGKLQLQVTFEKLYWMGFRHQG